MTRHLKTALLTIALAASCTVGSVTAQSSDRVNPLAPGEGDTVVILNTSGDEVATITVDEVIDDWDDYPSNHKPRSGTRYVAFALEIEAMTDNLKISSNELDLQVDPGVIIDSTSVQTTDDDLPIMPKNITLNDGDTEMFAIVYAVPEDAAYSSLFLNDGERLVTIFTSEDD